jgi:hypothetical protein
MDHDKARPFTPADSLDSLPRLSFNPQTTSEEHDFRQAELLQSVLAIARVDHVFESKIVREVVKAAIGQVPEIDE